MTMENLKWNIKTKSMLHMPKYVYALETIVVIIETSICISKCVKMKKYQIFTLWVQQIIMQYYYKSCHSCEISMADAFSKYNKAISEESIVLRW